MIERYNKLNNNNNKVESEIPKTFTPSPILKNYKKGFIDRYFLQKRGNNNAPIFEVNEDEFKKRKFPYKSLKIKWHIIGELEDKMKGNILYPSVITLNKKEIEKAVKEMPDIKQHLVNLKQFWKPL